jgi:DNA polymerase-3 subunit delta
LVQCDPIARSALPGFIEKAAKQRGHAMSSDVSELLAEIAGPELGYVIDAVERLSLYVGEGAPIRDEDVSVCVTRIRLSTVWELVGALGRRDPATALSVLSDVYDPQDRGLPLVGILSYSVRQLLKFAIARQNGASPEEAAQKAGAPPFKARELASQVRNVPTSTFESWLSTLAETDLSLKGSKRHPRSVLENAILTMTTSSPR